MPVSADLWNVLAPAQAFAKRSHGAFDVTVGPLVSLWKKSRRVGQLPPPEVLARARQAVGYEKLRLDRRHRTVQLMVPGMRLDLGGIAKGYALDEAQKVLRAQGIRRALVTSASGGVNTSFASSIWLGWMAHFPSIPSAAPRRAAARYPSESLKSPNGPSIGRSPYARQATIIRVNEACHWSPG